MELRKTEFELNGVRYLVNKYSLDKALRIFKKMGKIAGRPIGLLASQAKPRKAKAEEVKAVMPEHVGEEAKPKEGLDQDVDGHLLGDAIQAFFDNIEDEKLMPLFQDLLGGTAILSDDGRNRPINLELDFQDNIAGLFLLVKNVLEFQFGNLLQLAGAFSAPSTRTVEAEPTNRLKAL